MIIPDKEVLRNTCGLLNGRRFDDKHPEAFARVVVETMSALPIESANSVMRYLLTVSTDGILEYLGDPAPSHGGLVALRYALTEIARHAEEGTFKVSEEELTALRGLLLERDPFMTSGSTSAAPTAQRSSSGMFVRPSAFASPDATPPSGQPMVRRLPKANSLDSSSGFPAPGSGSVGMGGGSQEAAAMMLAKQGKNDSKTTARVVALFVVALVLGGAAAWSKLRVVQAKARLVTVETRLTAVSVALERYYSTEAIYPKDLPSLYATPGYFQEESAEDYSLIRDPFSGRIELRYLRGVDGYLLASMGPSRKVAPVEWPPASLANLRQEVLTTSYDPTNGTFSLGNIYAFKWRE